jgi:hypothetical protein
MAGWPGHIFVDVTCPEFASCPICLRVMRDASVVTCGHSFCDVCVTTQLDIMNDNRCAVCRVAIEHAPKPNWTLRSLFRRKAIKCVCEWTGTLADWDTHRRGCAQNREHCLRCNVVVPSCEMKHHSAATCSHRHVQCNFCREFMAAIQLEHHKQEACLRRPLPCPRCQESMPAQLITSHMLDTCPENTIACPVGAERCLKYERKHMRRHVDEDHTPLEAELAKCAKELRTTLRNLVLYEDDLDDVLET